MAKLLGPDFISLQVRDLAASTAFYRDVLGWAVDESFTAPNFVLFDSSTIPFGIRQADANLAGAPQPGAGIALWIDCDNVDELHAKLRSAGATVINPPADGPFGRSVVFLDPDGYRITANQNPWERFPLGGRSRSQSGR
jgi:predicted enzyme related to lactoylglutathione lyase